MEKALIRAEAESTKAQEHLDLYKKTLQEREELRAKLQQRPKEETRRMDHYENWSYTEEEEEKGMDVDPPEKSPGTGNTTPRNSGRRGETTTTPPRKKVEATEQELRDYPAIRLPLKGVPKIIEDRPPTNNERERIKELLATNTVISNLKKKRKENKRGPVVPNWNEMELFSGGEEREDNDQPPKASLETTEQPRTTTSLEERIAARVLAHLRGERYGDTARELAPWRHHNP